MKKGISFAEARKLMGQLESGQIIRPDAAKQAELDSLKGEWQNIWTFRDLFLSAALQGGQPPTVATLEAAELLALETMRRRIADVVRLSQASAAPINSGTRFVAGVLGVELPEEAPQPPHGEANGPPKLVQAH